MLSSMACVQNYEGDISTIGLHLMHPNAACKPKKHVLVFILCLSICKNNICSFSVKSSNSCRYSGLQPCLVPKAEGLDVWSISDT